MLSGAKNHKTDILKVFLQSLLENVVVFKSARITNNIYLGDYQTSGKFAEQKRYYTKNLDKVGLLQIPHHGLENNINKKLYKNKRIHLISAGVNDYYGHPDLKTLIEISNKGGFVCRTTEDANTKLEFIYTL
jgi:beta-lactamase superfamily II metal-dependent hydrolase